MTAHMYFRTADLLVAELLVTWLCSLKNAHKPKEVRTNEPWNGQSCSWGKAVHLETWNTILECCLRTSPVGKAALLNPIMGFPTRFCHGSPATLYLAPLGKPLSF